MNNRKAKRLRKIVYKQNDFRIRQYGAVENSKKPGCIGQLVNMGQLEESGTPEKPRKVSKRRIFQYCKIIARQCKIVNLERELLNQ